MVNWASCMRAVCRNKPIYLILVRIWHRSIALLCSPAYHLSLIHICHVPFSIFAPSVGPFKSYKRYISCTFSCAEIVCFREDISNTYFSDLKPKKKAIVTLDSAFQHPIDMDYNEKQYGEYTELKEYVEKYERVIGITVTLSYFSTYSFNSEMCIRDRFITVYPHFHGNN